jgi:hypothetical protein
MKRKLEKTEKRLNHLQEIATLYAKDMIIEVYNDHGEIGNPKNPAHAHLKKADGTFLGKFTITKQPPSDKTKIFDCYKEPKTEKIIPIPSEYKDKIIKWAIEKYPSDEDGEITNWGALKLAFRMLNPKD